MDPIVRRDHNTVYLGPTREVGDLSCRRIEPGLIVSHWRPSAAELDVLGGGGSVLVAVCSEPIPPLAIGVESAGDDTEPERVAACVNCGATWSYLAAIRGSAGEELRHCAACRKVFAVPTEARNGR